MLPRGRAVNARDTDDDDDAPSAGRIAAAGGMERHARPPATTVSTIAVRSGDTRIVIALLQVRILVVPAVPRQYDLLRVVSR